MYFFTRIKIFIVLFGLGFSSLFLSFPSFSQEPSTPRNHSITVTYDDPPHFIGPSPDLDQALDHPPTDEDLEQAVGDRSNPLYPLARFYLDLNQTLGPEPHALCVDVKVRKGLAQFMVSLPTDEAFEIGDSRWTRAGFENWKTLKQALILTSKTLKSWSHSDSPIDWNIDGYADALPYLNSGDRTLFYDIRKYFELSHFEKYRDLEKQRDLARSRAESYRLPILNPEEDLQDWVRIQNIKGHASEQIELNSALWSAENRALPAHKSFFNEASLLACKTRRKIKFTTTGTLGTFPILKRTHLFETQPTPSPHPIYVAEFAVTPHFLDHASLISIKNEILREVHQSFNILGLSSGHASDSETMDWSKKALKNLSDRGVFIECTPEDYLCTLALKFIQSQLEGKGEEASFGDHFITLIHSGLASLRSLALDIPKEIDHQTVDSVGDLIALYKIPNDHWLEWGETRIRGEALLSSHAEGSTPQAIRLVLPDGNYTCTRCGSGTIVKNGSLTTNSRLIDRPDIFKESIAHATQKDANVLGSILSPTAYFVTGCSSDCTQCGGVPIDSLISRSSDPAVTAQRARVFVLNPALHQNNTTDLISPQDFKTGCLVTRKVLESCNVEPEESHAPSNQQWSTHWEETILPAQKRIQSDPEIDSNLNNEVLPLRAALKRLKCSSSPETTLPTWDQYGDCHLDAWRPESGPGSWEWFQKKSRDSTLDDPIEDDQPKLFL
jgi:hypothetical protein